MAKERFEITVDEFLVEGRGVQISIEWGSLRFVGNLANRIGRLLTPFREWGIVPHSDLGSAIGALSPRAGEPPDAGFVIENPHRKINSTHGGLILHPSAQ